MAKRQNFVVGSTNPNTESRSTEQLNNGWNRYEVLKSGVLDGVFNAVSDFSNDSSNEIANAIVELTGSQPTGETQTELATALHQMREDIETTSLTFKGYVSATQPSASDYDFQVGNIWIQSATLPTSFPVAIAGVWNGTQWESTTNTYTQKDFDFFRNVNDNEGYYWFGGQWVVMSTDMSTTYFTLNQTSGKWEIKSSVNLPGAPTAATPTSGSSSSQIATKGYVDSAISGVGDYHPELLSHEWDDHERSDMNWVNAFTFSWQDRTDHQVAYDHLADNLPAEVPTIELTDLVPFARYVSGDAIGGPYPYCWRSGTTNRYTASETPSVGDYAHTTSDGGLGIRINGIGSSLPVPETETISGITISFYTANNGRKICLADQESNVAAIYAATGVAWYYIIDTTNQRFKLPRTEFAETGLRDTVGKYVEAGSPNITGSGYDSIAVGDASTFTDTASGAFYCGNAKNARRARYDGSATENACAISFDASRSNSIYGNSDTVQPPATQMYLYFYVGGYTQSAVENTAGLNTSLFNNKADLDLANVNAAGKSTAAAWGIPDYSSGIAYNSSFTAPSNGYCLGSGNVAAWGTLQLLVNGYVADAEHNNTATANALRHVRGFVKKGDVVNLGPTFGEITFFPLIGG